MSTLSGPVAKDSPMPTWMMAQESLAIMTDEQPMCHTSSGLGDSLWDHNDWYILVYIDGW